MLYVIPPTSNLKTGCSKLNRDKSIESNNRSNIKDSKQKIQKIKRQKHQITLRLDLSTIDYFKEMAQESGISYQNLIDLYLRDCVKNKLKLIFNK